MTLCLILKVGIPTLGNLRAPAKHVHCFVPIRIRGSGDSPQIDMGRIARTANTNGNETALVDNDAYFNMAAKQKLSMLLFNYFNDYAPKE